MASMFPQEIDEALSNRVREWQKTGCVGIGHLVGCGSVEVATFDERIERGRVLAGTALAVRRFRCSGCGRIWVAAVDYPNAPDAFGFGVNPITTGVVSVNELPDSDFLVERATLMPYEKLLTPGMDREKVEETIKQFVDSLESLLGLGYEIVIGFERSATNVRPITYAVKATTR